MSTRETRLHIEGMSCGHCIGRVRSTLQQIPSVEVLSLQLGSAVVRYLEGETTPDAIARALTSDGYAATPQPA
ncbi:MAG TPA: cation transporter [Gemmatimonadales bacterium]|nr:cation transporter [Gemmatimonadales bacterium]